MELGDGEVLEADLVVVGVGAGGALHHAPHCSLTHRVLVYLSTLAASSVSLALHDSTRRVAHSAPVCPYTLQRESVQVPGGRRARGSV